MSNKILKAAKKYSLVSNKETHYKGAIEFIKATRKETGCSLESGKTLWNLYRYAIKIKREIV